MQGRRFEIFGTKVNTSNISAASRHWFWQDTAAAADIKNFFTRQAHLCGFTAIGTHKAALDVVFYPIKA